MGETECSYSHTCVYTTMLHMLTLYTYYTCTCMYSTRIYILCVTETGLVVGYALSLDNDNTFMVETVHHYYKPV